MARLRVRLAQAAQGSGDNTSETDLVDFYARQIRLAMSEKVGRTPAGAMQRDFKREYFIDPHAVIISPIERCQKFAEAQGYSFTDKHPAFDLQKYLETILSTQDLRYLNSEEVTQRAHFLAMRLQNENASRPGSRWHPTQIDHIRKHMRDVKEDGGPTPFALAFADFTSAQSFEEWYDELQRLKRVAAVDTVTPLSRGIYSPQNNEGRVFAPPVL